MDGDPGNCLQKIIALFILVLLSAFFSSVETAYSSVSQIKIKTKADDKNKSAEKVMKLLENYDKLLSTILVGNNIVNIMAASIGTMLFIELVGEDNGPAMSTAVLTLVILIFGEVSPKSLAKDHAEAITLATSGIMKFLILALSPINCVFTLWKKLLHIIFGGSEDKGITEEELATIINQVEADGNLEKQETDLLKSALEFNDIEVAEILIPRVDIEAIADTASIDELKQLFEDTGYSRIPVYHEDIDHIIGVVMEKDTYRLKDNKSNKVKQLVKSIIYVATSTKISNVLQSLQRGKSHMAIVLDEYGGTAGIVTLEDILEELVGEIWDEHDEVEEPIKKQSDGSIIATSNADISDIFEIFDIDDECDATSIPALVVENIGKVPETGDKFTYDTLEIVVTKTEGHRVTEVKVGKLEPA